MAIIITRHDLTARDVLSPQQGDAVSVANGAASDTLPAGLYRVYATDKCTVRIGADTATGGMPFAADQVEVFYSQGGKFAVASRA